MVNVHSIVKITQIIIQIEKYSFFLTSKEIVVQMLISHCCICVFSVMTAILWKEHPYISLLEFLLQLLPSSSAVVSVPAAACTSCVASQDVSTNNLNILICWNRV